MAAQHRTDRNRSALIGAIILTVIAVIAVVAALVYLAVKDRDSNSDAAAGAGDCAQGELIIPVAEQTPGAAHDFISSYADTHPTFQDHCVTPQVVDSIEQAALFVGVDSPATDALLHSHGLAKVEAPTAVLGTRPVGVSTAQPVADPGTLTADRVFYPSTQAPDVAVVAATALTGDPAAAEALVSRDKGADIAAVTANPDAMIATVDTAVPEGRSFTPVPGAVLPYAAIPVISHNDNGAQPDQVRAAVAAVEQVAQKATPAPELNPETRGALEHVYAALGLTALPRVPAPAPEAQPAPQPAGDDANASAPATEQPGKDGQDPAAPAPAQPAQAMQTLFLLDASEQITGVFPQATDAIAQSAGALQERGQLSSLWNYSSPLNPGVVRPWRANLGFTQGSDLPEVLNQFGTGGVPMTRTSLLEALRAGADQAAATAQPVRVVLVTSGTAAQDITPDPEFIQQVKDIAGNAVSLSVVHVGSAPVDEGLKNAAHAFTQVADPAHIVQAVRTAAGAQ
ncbi:hypothetical protein ACUY3K_02115 [Corynebacterium uberis]|uniref:hypothetical protein n=1 Tax=Corynebacterium uberis TaxID=2883169 RepID=UPI001D0A72AE|nr:hypothetical protein [Corynebacterium uberis]UDL74336.1 hypothetical protein LH391_03790 [Corynebacterium uberis]UDL83458.1 hypothetical protein LH395_05610 [Corynebacterium uberis]